MSHWIIAPVLLPALTAALTLLPRRGSLLAQRGLSLGASLLLCGLGLWLLGNSATPQLYRLGDWPAPFGIVMMLDPLSALMLVMTALLALAVLIHVLATGLDREGRHFHSLFLFQLAGLNGAFLTADAFNLFVFFELLLIASYGLMIHGAGARRLRAGLHYVAINLFGSAVFLVALALLYAVTGTLNMADLAQRIAALPPGDAALIRVAAVLMLSVFAIKGALVPFQFWMPLTYANAPGAVAALFAVMTKVGAYALLRSATLIFAPSSAAIGDLPARLILPAALITLLLGAAAVLGMAQNPRKDRVQSTARQAAFAAMSSMGLVFAAIASLTAEGIAAALYYMVHSTLAAAILFLVCDLIQRSQTRTEAPSEAPAAPVATLFFLSAIAMTGLSPLSGFLGKLMVMQALPIWSWAVILVATLLMVLGFSRMGRAIFWQPAQRAPSPPPRQLLAPMLLGAALIGWSLCAGLASQWLIPVSKALIQPDAWIAANALAQAKPQPPQQSRQAEQSGQMPGGAAP